MAHVWIPSADMSVERVRERKRRGGHWIDEETVRRRYERGLRNFVELYAPLADSWTLGNNSGPELRLVALGGKNSRTTALEEPAYTQIRRTVPQWPLKKRQSKA